MGPICVRCLSSDYYPFRREYARNGRGVVEEEEPPAGIGEVRVGLTAKVLEIRRLDPYLKPTPRYPPNPQSSRSDDHTHHTQKNVAHPFLIVSGVPCFNILLVGSFFPCVFVFLTTTSFYTISSSHPCTFDRTPHLKTLYFLFGA
jgi:hypothetical protein